MANAFWASITESSYRPSFAYDFDNKTKEEDNQKLATDLEKLLEEEAPNIDLTQYPITDWFQYFEHIAVDFDD